MNSGKQVVTPPYLTQVTDGIWCIELPHTDFQTVNAYLFEGTPLTLLDAGAPTEASISQLQLALQHLGYQWEDIGRLLLTHAHIDHIGGAAFLPPPAEILALTGTAANVGDYESWMNRWHHYPVWLSEVYPELAALFLNQQSRTWMGDMFPRGGHLSINREFAHGQTIDLGRWKLQAIHTPGHDMLHTCYYLEEQQLLFSGDYILSRGPALARYMGDEANAFRDSVQQVAHLAVKQIWPSHGKPFGFQQGLSHIRSLLDRQSIRLLQRLHEGRSTALDLFFAYYGSRHFHPASIAMDFSGVDCLIQHLLDQGVISKTGIWYALA